MNVYKRFHNGYRTIYKCRTRYHYTETSNPVFPDNRIGENMTYEPDKYKIGESKKGPAEPGTKEESVLKVVQEGTLGQFVSDLSKWQNASPEDPAIQLTCENGAEAVFTLPKEGHEVHEKSNMARFMNLYDTPPKEGITVKTKANDQGYFRIVY